jgi:hypothetical protein
MQRTAFLSMKKEMRAEWGDKPCDHPRIVQERFLGMTTGAQACTVCGRDVKLRSETLAQIRPATSE